MAVRLIEVVESRGHLSRRFENRRRPLGMARTVAAGLMLLSLLAAFTPPARAQGRGGAAASSEPPQTVINLSR